MGQGRTGAPGPHGSTGHGAGQVKPAGFEDLLEPRFREIGSQCLKPQFPYLWPWVPELASVAGPLGPTVCLPQPLGLWHPSGRVLAAPRAVGMTLASLYPGSVQVQPPRGIS